MATWKKGPGGGDYAITKGADGHDYRLTVNNGFPSERQRRHWPARWEWMLAEFLPSGPYQIRRVAKGHRDGMTDAEAREKAMGAAEEALRKHAGGAERVKHPAGRAARRTVGQKIRVHVPAHTRKAPR